MKKSELKLLDEYPKPVVEYGIEEGLELHTRCTVLRKYNRGTE